MKPSLRTDAYYDIQAALETAIRKASEQNPIYKCCFNCWHINKKDELCKLVNKRPPIEVITFGCEKWEDKDEIPF